MNRAGLLLIALAGQRLALPRSYCPIPDPILKARRFPQTPLGRCDISSDDDEAKLRVGAQRVLLRGHRYGLEIAGTGPGIQSWVARTGGFGFGCWAVAADFDANGKRDLLIVSQTGGNGMAPSTRLLFFLTGRDGAMTPWVRYGYFTFDLRTGILDDLVDLDGDGRAELLDMDYGGGYWSTFPYQARESHWSRITGPFAGSEFPIWTRFTHRANRLPRLFPREKWPPREDFSNAPGEATATMLSFEVRSDGADFGFCDGVHLQRYRGALVIDLPGRRLAYLSPGYQDAERDRFLREIRDRKVPVRRSAALLLADLR